MKKSQIFIVLLLSKQLNLKQKYFCKPDNDKHIKFYVILILKKENKFSIISSIIMFLQAILLSFVKSVGHLSWKNNNMWDIQLLPTHRDIKKEAQKDDHKYFIVCAHTR